MNVLLVSFQWIVPVAGFKTDAAVWVGRPACTVPQSWDRLPS